MLQHDADTRPAWLWSQDGERLLWHNDAAALYLAKIKKYGLKLAAPAVPIKGQVARNIRLGSAGRTSLARIQFLGREADIVTCATTPLLWEDGKTVLLIVDVDPIEPEILAAAAAAEMHVEAVELVAVEQPSSDEPDTIDTAVAASEQPVNAPEPIAAIIEADEHAYERELESWRAADQEQA